MVRDGVYLEWLPGSELGEMPAAIACVEEDSISFHANTSDDRVIRFPLRNTFPEIRGSLTGIGDSADFTRRARMKLDGYLESELAASRRIEHFAARTRESAIWRAVAESWWDDFDTLLPVVGPRLMAGARLVEPNIWHVAVGFGVNDRHSFMSLPSLQFRVQAASLDDVSKKIRALLGVRVGSLHRLIGAFEIESE